MRRSMLNSILEFHKDSVGPVLWLLIMNRLLDDLKEDRNYKVVDFADDLLVMLRAPASYHFKELTKNPLRIIDHWAIKYKLCINHSKSNYTIIKRGKNATHFPSIKINDKSINYVRVIKYLGVLFNKNLTFFDHLSYVQNKTYKMFYKIKNISRDTWGITPLVVKELHKLVYEKMVLYACPIWYKDGVKVTQELLQIQRLTILVITKCYRIVATDSLCVMAGCFPLDLMAKLECDYYKRVHSNNSDLYKINFSLRSNLHDI